MAGTKPAMTPEPALLFFPGLRGRAAGGHPGYPPALPRPGKNHHRLAVPPYGITALFAADGAGKIPGMRMENAPHPEAEGRRVGVPLARPLTGRISKGYDKGDTE
jgi:hypothetical protein